MKRLLAISALLLPLCLFAQGFGSFSHDQPFFAKNAGVINTNCGFSPTNISGCFFWGIVGPTTLYSGGGVLVTNRAYEDPVDPQRVTLWKDSSGAGNDVTNAIGGLTDPIFWTPAQSIYFSSGNTCYLTNRAMATKNQPITTYVVYWVSNVFASRTLFDSGSTANRVSMSHNSSSNLTMYAGGGMGIANGVMQNQTWYVATGVFNGASSITRTNGVQAATGNVGTQTMASGFTIGNYSQGGAGNGMYGFIREVLFFSGAHTTAQMRQIELYLGCANNITIY